jgi:3'(2'), 5'-bisphosphate nucleotidase
MQGRMDDNALLELAFTLAARAGEIILDVRREGFRTMYKEDFSIVTVADHRAEAAILAGLREATPEIPVIAEEEVAAGRVPRLAERYWLVDPLDGTREFAAGSDDFAVCIGLIEGDAPSLGVVAGPARGEAFGAIKGQGAQKRDASGARAIHVRAMPAEGATVIASVTSGRHPSVDRFLRSHRVAKFSQFGSALKFCRIAEGVADLYPRFGRTMEWDTAAGQILLEEAGGSVCDAGTGKPLRYGKPGFENGAFIAASS